MIFAGLREKLEMANWKLTIERFHADQAGQTTVEWSLLIAAFGLPMLFVFREILGALAGFYGFITCMITLPLP